MGELESDVKKRERYGKLEKVVLGLLLSIGVLSIAVLAPNALQALGQIKGIRKYARRQGIKRAVNRLQEKGLVVFEKTERGVFVRITERGQLALGQRSVKKSRRQRKWDKKWRLVIFDVPERKRKTRDKVRRMLKQFGFYRLQDSVWAYPYDCEDIVILLKADLRIGKDVLYIIADRIEHDVVLKQHFKL